MWPPQTPQGRTKLLPKQNSGALSPPPSPCPRPAHFFSFSPTAGDAAGLLGFSLGGDGEWLWLRLRLRLWLRLRLGLGLRLRVRLRLRDGLRDQLLRLLLWCRGPRPPRRYRSPERERLLGAPQSRREAVRRQGPPAHRPTRALNLRASARPCGLSPSSSRCFPQTSSLAFSVSKQTVL